MLLEDHFAMRLMQHQPCCRMCVKSGSSGMWRLSASFRTMCPFGQTLYVAVKATRVSDIFVILSEAQLRRVCPGSVLQVPPAPQRVPGVQLQPLKCVRRQLSCRYLPSSFHPGEPDSHISISMSIDTHVGFSYIIL